MRFALNVFAVSIGAPQIWEMPNATFKQVLELRKEHEFDESLFCVVRKGAKGDVRTSYEIALAEKTSQRLREQLRAVELYNLADQLGQAAQGFPSQGPVAVGSREIAIDLTTAWHFIGRLRELSRTQIDAFLRHFGVRRVADQRQLLLPVDDNYFCRSA
ncbi:MAG: hypothetical protein ACRELY_16385, partial [Polyangiaceae bacterium]